MAAPLGATGKAGGDHRRRKNGASAEAFAAHRAECNAARGKQIWVWDNEAQRVGHWERTAATA